MKIDAIGKQALKALIDDGDASAADISDRIGVAEDVVRARLGKLRMDGFLLGRTVRLDPSLAGFPYEAITLGAPSDLTEREDLMALAESPRVGRMFALAMPQSIAFTVYGRDVEDVESRAASLADQAHLIDTTTVLIVDVMADDPAGGIRRAWRQEADPRGIVNREPSTNA